MLLEDQLRSNLTDHNSGTIYMILQLKIVIFRNPTDRDQRLILL